MEILGTAAIVAGGASGLGAATARMLATNGAKVTIFDLNEAVGKVTGNNKTKAKGKAARGRGTGRKATGRAKSAKR